MKMKLTLTSNNNKNLTQIYDWDDIIKVFDVTQNEEHDVKVALISIYDDQPVIDGVRYRILNACSY